MSNASLLPVISKNRWGERQSYPSSRPLYRVPATLLTVNSPRITQIMPHMSLTLSLLPLALSTRMLSAPSHFLCICTMELLLSHMPGHNHSPTTPMTPLALVTGTSLTSPYVTLQVVPSQYLPNARGSQAIPGRQRDPRARRSPSTVLRTTPCCLAPSSNFSHSSPCRHQNP